MQSSTRFASAALLGLAFACIPAPAQTPKADSSDAAAQAAHSESQAPRPEPKPYLLSIAVKETSGGKEVLEKKYAFTVVADDTRYHAQTLRDGIRVPLAFGKETQYQDVGTNIDASDVTRRGDALAVSLRLTSSALVANSTGNSPDNLPQISQWSVGVVAVLLPNKPAIIYSAADEVSGHKVEIQATAQPVNNQ